MKKLLLITLVLIFQNQLHARAYYHLGIYNEPYNKYSMKYQNFSREDMDILCREYDLLYDYVDGICYNDIVWYEMQESDKQDWTIYI